MSYIYSLNPLDVFMELVILMFLGITLQRAMKGFTERIVELMKSEDLYESQGGPIILSQVNTF